MENSFRTDTNKWQSPHHSNEFVFHFRVRKRKIPLAKNKLNKHHQNCWNVLLFQMTCAKRLWHIFSKPFNTKKRRKHDIPSPSTWNVEEEENVQIFFDLFDFDDVDSRWNPRTRWMAAHTADGLLSRCTSPTSFSLGAIGFKWFVWSTVSNQKLVPYAGFGLKHFSWVTC